MISQMALGAALLACLAGVSGYFHGMTVGKAQEIAAQKRADQAAARIREKLQKQINAATQAAQSNELARQQSVREITHETHKIIEKPVYRTVCIDADGVGLLDRAASTANGDDSAPPTHPTAKIAAGSPQP